MNELGKRGIETQDSTPPPSEVQKQKKPRISSVSNAFEELSISLDSTLISQKKLDKALFTKSQEIKQGLSADNELLDSYGSKHGNLVRMERLFLGLNLTDMNIEVPTPHGFTTENINKILIFNNLGIEEEWKELGSLYKKYENSNENFLEREDVKKLLEKIKKNISDAVSMVSEYDFKDTKFSRWLESAKNDYLMVRSSGSEDSRQSANAGGNISCKYVSPNWESFSQAAKEVVCSYFDYASLHNQIVAGINPFEKKPKLSLTAQKLMGEEPLLDPSKSKNIEKENIPISLVLFTNEPLYVGDESFRTMRISATYGHGEGVVGSVGVNTDTILLLVSEAHPDQLYVLYDNVDKPVRLAPVYTSEGVQVQLVENSESLRKQPVLNSEMLSRLFSLGIITEKFFDDTATDMEIVIKGNKIYPVQARPIIRKPLLPTYLNVKEIQRNVRSGELESTPIQKTIRGTALVPGAASVMIFTDPKRICFASNLETAERMFTKEKYDAVIVTQPEPANTHPIVNFSSNGIPCLFIKDKESIDDLLKKGNAKNPIVLCMQEGAVHLWDNNVSEVAKYISKGYTVHPAKIAISLPVGLSRQTHKKTQEVPEDVKELIMSIRSSETNEIALEVLGKLKESSFVENLQKQNVELKKKMKQHEFLPKHVHETHETVGYLIQKVDMAFKETASALKNASKNERLRPLLHVKVLDTLLFGADSQVSRISVEPFIADAVELIAYQEKFSHPVRFADIYLAGDAALSDASKVAWKEFLEKLEGTEISSKQVQELHELIRILENSNMLATWFAFYFNPNQSIEEVLGTIPEADKKHLNATLEINAKIKNLRENLESFGKQGTFEAVRKELTTLTLSTIKDSIPTTQLSPVIKFVVLNTLLQAVDLFDLAVKQMKMSSEWTQVEKIPIFKSMIADFLLFLKVTVNSFFNVLGPNLKAKLPDYLEELSEHFTRTKFEANPSQLNPSRNFSVAAATVGSGTLFSRHYPLTLEDFFTLIHQNFIIIVSNCTNSEINDEMIQKSNIPEELKKFIEILPNGKTLDFEIKRVGIQLNKNTFEVLYNIPLRNHSAQLILSYDKDQEKTIAIGRLMGEGRDRWSAMAFTENALDVLNTISLHEPIQKSDQEIKFSWEVKDEKTLKFIIMEFLELCRESFNMGSYTRVLNKAFDAEKIVKVLKRVLLYSDRQDLDQQLYIIYRLIVKNQCFEKFDNDVLILEKMLDNEIMLQKMVEFLYLTSSQDDSLPTSFQKISFLCVEKSLKSGNFTEKFIFLFKNLINNDVKIPENILKLAYQLPKKIITNKKTIGSATAVHIILFYLQRIGYSDIFDRLESEIISSSKTCLENNNLQEAKNLLYLIGGLIKGSESSVTYRNSSGETIVGILKYNPKTNDLEKCFIALADHFFSSLSEFEKDLIIRSEVSIYSKDHYDNESVQRVLTYIEKTITILDRKNNDEYETNARLESLTSVLKALSKCNIELPLKMDKLFVLANKTYLSVPSRGIDLYSALLSFKNNIEIKNAIIKMIEQKIEFLNSEKGLSNDNDIVYNSPIDSLKNLLEVLSKNNVKIPLSTWKSLIDLANKVYKFNTYRGADLYLALLKFKQFDELKEIIRQFLLGRHSYDGHRLFSEMIKCGGWKEAFEIAKDVKEKISTMTMVDMFTDLVKDGHCFPEALTVAQEQIDSDHEFTAKNALFLHQELVIKDFGKEEGFAKSIEAAEFLLFDQKNEYQAFELFLMIIKKGFGLNRCIEACKSHIYRQASSNFYNKYVVFLLKRLVEQNYGKEQIQLLSDELKKTKVQSLLTYSEEIDKILTV